MSLFLVGLGPDPNLLDLSQRAKNCLLGAERVLLDTLSSDAVELRQIALQELLHKTVEKLVAVEQQERQELYQQALEQDIAIAVAGDPLVESPYVFWLREAKQSACPVQVIPGLSAMTALPSLVGLDASRCQIFRLADYLYPEEQLLQDLHNALNLAPCLVLYSGKQASIDDDKWRLFARHFDVDFQLVRIGQAGASLLLIPKKSGALKNDDTR